MGEVKKVQEQNQGRHGGLERKMATMVEAMMSIKEMMDVSTAYRAHARARVMGEVEEVQE